jgi:D-alanyl-D-alanine-carboxypeptidase/D-alanyl-D-alanine-endopeptidase
MIESETKPFMKRYKSTLIVLLISFVTFQCQKSPEKTDKKGLPAEVVETIEKRIEEGITPSIALAIIDSSGVQYFNFGQTAENGKEVDENTIYEIGSISKVFTAILLAQQVLEGDLKLEDKINNIFPNDIKVPVVDDTEITFGNLTDHTSGLPGMPDNFAPANPNNPYADYTVDQMYEFISNYNPSRSVGSEYEYSNLAQGLLGHLIAMNKSSTYEELIVQVIANPLAMNDTRIELTQRMKERLALGHSSGKVVENWDIPTLAGAGAIRSSTSDMAKFISANLGYENSTLLEAMELSHQIRHDKAGEMSVAMAWHIKKGDNGDVIWHNGGTGGYRTFTGFVKETGKGVVLLSNSSAGADDIGFYLLDPGSELADIKFKSDAVDIPESTLEQYVGLYEIQPEFKIAITKEGKQLFAQATGQDRFEIYPENDTVFYLTIVEAKIAFHLEKGTVASLTLFQGGQEMLGKKTE